MKTLRPLSALALAVFGILAIAGSSGEKTHAAGDTANYELVFVPSWNPETHPRDYPITHKRKGYLTPMIGATHGPDYRIFAAGQKPTRGLELLSEMGKHTPLDNEIKKAIAAGKAGSLIEIAELSEGPVHRPLRHEFKVDKRNPMVSLVGMVAPSPDWFFGVSGVQLVKGGEWAPSVTVEVFAWDSGGDAGNTYMADDADLNPKQATKLLDFAFLQKGKRLPVGVFIFRRIPSMAT